MTQPWFFTHLGLEATEDTAAIRRAYAAALKRIDQETDRAGFERLRDAYQRALDWARQPAEYDDDEDYDDEIEAEAPAPAFEPAAADAVPVVVAHGPRIEREEGPAAAETIDLAAEAAARDAAIEDWIGRLMAGAGPDRLGQALADPRLAHLDARYEFEERLLQALYEDPDGRHALFEAAAAAFDWRGDQLRLLGEGEETAWLRRVVNQADHWAAQPKIVRRRRDLLLKRIKPAPGPLRLWHDGPMLVELAEEYPDLLALRLPPGRLDVWLAGKAELSSRWYRLERVAAFLDPRRMTTRRFVVLMLVAGMISAFVQGWNRKYPETLPVETDVAQPADPPLAYEFTGPNNAETCGMAESFAAESNWLSIDDDLARALLVTRILDCRMHGWWTPAHAPLADCLRAERLAALQAARPENFGTCATVEP